MKYRMPNNRSNQKAFTLIELLVEVSPGSRNRIPNQKSTRPPPAPLA